MLAGHVLLSVFSSLFVFLSFISFCGSFFFLGFCVVFFLFEIAVCFVQGVVFVLLLLSYFSEVFC